MTRPDRRSLTVPALMAAAAALLLVLGVPGALGVLTPKITNTGNRAASNSYYTCTAATQGDLAAQDSYLAYPLAETAGTTANDVSSNGRNGLYTSAGITYRTTGAPCKRDSSAGFGVTLNGTSGYISGPSTTVTNPSVFSLEIWFKTSVAAGKLIGFGNARTGASGVYDRHLYVDANGKLEFGVYPGSAKVVVSAATVTDGKWHHAAATLSSAGMVMYLDGAQVGADTAVTTAENSTGYWRIGYDNLSGWNAVPSSSYFKGDLAWPQVYSYALSADQVKSHYVAGTP